MTALSVIIPAKDVAPYIGDTMNSLIRNHCADFEYIVVDDGSTDDTLALVEEFRDRLPGLRTLRNELPQGPSTARNQALEVSSGAYITYLDADDWFAAGYLPRALQAIESLGVDFIKTDQVRVFGQRRVRHPVPEGRVNRALPAREGVLPTTVSTMVDYPNACTGLYSRGLADRGLLTFDTSLVTAEDRMWTWKLHLNADTCARVPITGSFYRRQVQNSLTQVGDERQLHFFAAFDKIVALVAADRDAEAFLPKAVRSYCATILYHIDNRARLTPELQKKLVERSTRTLRELPAQVLDLTVREMGGKAEKRLRALHDHGSITWEKRRFL